MALSAIVKVNGKQYLAQKGERLVVDRMADKKEGSTIKITEVLLTIDGRKTSVGTPTVKGAVVEAKVIAHPRGPKGYAFRFKRKKRERRIRGYRADYTELEVTSVTA